MRITSVLIVKVGLFCLDRENLCSCEIGFMKLGWKKIEYIIGHILYCLMNHQAGVVAIRTLEARLCALALPGKLGVACEKQQFIWMLVIL